MALIGAGALGGMIGLGLVRKGVGSLHIYDGDDVEVSNLNRQLFYPQDLGKNKAQRLAKNLARESFSKCELRGIGLYFEEAVGQQDPEFTLGICAPDNDDIRMFCAEWFGSRSIPLVTLGLAPSADYGYAHVTESGSQLGCWLCLNRGNRGEKPCEPAASTLNLVMHVVGLTLAAADALIGGTDLCWNYGLVSLSGTMPCLRKRVPIWADCPVCRAGSQTGRVADKS